MRSGTPRQRGVPGAYKYFWLLGNEEPNVSRPEDPGRRQEQRRLRRLITLISAGRNRTIVIRRELPLTRSAGWDQSRYRIKDRRVLLSVCPAPVTCTDPQNELFKESRAKRREVGIASFKLLAGGFRRVLSRPRGARRRAALTGAGAAARGCWRQCHRLGRSRLRVACTSSFGPFRNRPDKAEQFTSDRRDNLRLVFPASGHLFVTSAKPPLRF